MWAVIFWQSKYDPVTATDGEALQEVAGRAVEGFESAFVLIVVGADAADTMFTR